MVMNGTQWYQVVLSGDEWYQTVQNDEKIAPNHDKKWYRMLTNGTDGDQWYQMVIKCRLRIIRICSSITTLCLLFIPSTVENILAQEEILNSS